MSQLDPENTGFVTETQFIQNIKENYDDYELDEILSFALIPEEALEEVNMKPNQAGNSHINVRNDRVF